MNLQKWRKPDASEKTFVQWMVVKTETHKYSKCCGVLIQKQETYIIPPTPKAQETSRKRRRKDRKSQRLESTQAKQGLLNMAGTLHS